MYLQSGINRSPPSRGHIGFNHRLQQGSLQGKWLETECAALLIGTRLGEFKGFGRRGSVGGSPRSSFKKTPGSWECARQPRVLQPEMFLSNVCIYVCIQAGEQ